MRMTHKLIVGFSAAKGNKPFSWLIKWVTKSQVSHAFILLADGGDILVYQASGLRVNYEYFDTFLTEETIFETYSFDLTPGQASANEHYRKKHVGDRYAWREIFGYAWVLFMRKWGKVVRNPWSGGEHAAVCVDEAAAQIPWMGKLGVEAEGEGTMTPEDLRRWCQKNGKAIRIGA